METLTIKANEMVINILPPLMDLLSWLMQNSDLVAISLGSVVTAMVAIKGVKFAGKIGDAISQMKDFGKKILDVASNIDFIRLKQIALTVEQSALTAAQWLMNVAMIANPIGVIIPAIAALVTGFILLWNNCEDFRNFVDNFVNSVKEFFVNGWNAIVLFFTETIPNFIASIGEWFNRLPYQLGFMIGQAIGHIIQFGIDLWNYVPAMKDILRFLNYLPNCRTFTENKPFGFYCLYSYMI